MRQYIFQRCYIWHNVQVTLKMRTKEIKKEEVQCAHKILGMIP